LGTVVTALLLRSVGGQRPGQRRPGEAKAFQPVTSELPFVACDICERAILEAVWQVSRPAIAHCYESKHSLGAQQRWLLEA